MTARGAACQHSEGECPLIKSVLLGQHHNRAPLSFTGRSAACRTVALWVEAACGSGSAGAGIPRRSTQRHTIAGESRQVTTSHSQDLPLRTGTCAAPHIKWPSSTHDYTYHWCATGAGAFSPESAFRTAPKEILTAPISVTLPEAGLDSAPLLQVTLTAVAALPTASTLGRRLRAAAASSAPPHGPLLPSVFNVTAQLTPPYGSMPYPVLQVGGA